MTTSKAKVTTVPFLPTAIEGLLLPDGTFAVSISQVIARFSIPQKNASRDLKALLGAESGFPKVAWETTNAKINVLTLEQYGELRKQLAIRGNQAALAEVLALSGLSDQQLFSDAFGIKFEQADRLQWVKARAEGKVDRRTLTDAIQDYCLRNECKPTYCQWVYSNVTDIINRGLFGGTAKQLITKRQADSLRDAFDATELRTLSHAEAHIMRLIDRRNLKPEDAAKAAMELFS
jgi:hypothetical protein